MLFKNYKKLNDMLSVFYILWSYYKIHFARFAYFSNTTIKISIKNETKIPVFLNFILAKWRLMTSKPYWHKSLRFADPFHFPGRFRKHRKTFLLCGGATCSLQADHFPTEIRPSFIRKLVWRIRKPSLSGYPKTKRGGKSLQLGWVHRFIQRWWGLLTNRGHP